MILDTQKKVRTTRLLSLSSEALDFAAPSTSGLADFAMQVVQVMYLVDGNNLEAQIAKRQNISLNRHDFRTHASVLHWIEHLRATN